MTANQVNYSRLREDRRHNVVGEGETQRHNVATEQLTRSQIGLGFSNLAELARHNRQSEGLEQGKINLGFSQLGETTRHNQQQESTALYDAFGRVVSASRQAGAAEKRAETERKAQEEVARHNSAMEGITTRGQDVSADTAKRGQNVSLANGLINSFVPILFDKSSRKGAK